MGMKETLAVHPAPWHARQGPPGVITMIDANGAVVELLTMINFVQQATASIAAAAASAKPAETAPA